nr:LysR family transcriptional regulator [Paraburkholderia ginsengiterrae]
MNAWLVLVETGSIRGAAGHLHLSQAAVIKAIRELEQDLGASLILPSSRGFILTKSSRKSSSRKLRPPGRRTLRQRPLLATRLGAAEPRAGSPQRSRRARPSQSRPPCRSGMLQSPCR